MRGRRSYVVFALLCLLLGMAGLVPAGAHQGGEMAVVGNFEIDGDLEDDPPAAIDWDTPPPNLTAFTDATGRSDDSFGQGSKELDPANWKCITNSAPGKDDIISGAVAFDTVGDDQWAYVNYTRAAVNGDAHFDYEFNQSTEPNPSCPDLPLRQANDIVITFDTENGGKTIDVRAFRWVGTAAAGTFQPLDVGSHGSTFDGAVNIPNSIPGHKAGDFGEAALNLTETIGEIACGQFATAYMKTRASTSINAAIKDYTKPKNIDVGLCPESSIAKGVRNVTDGQSAFGSETVADPGETLEYQLTYENAGEGVATGVVVTDALEDRQSFVSCATATGTCSHSTATRTLSWNIGTVQPGGTAVLTFLVTLDESFPAGTTVINNVAVADSAEEQPTSSPPTTVTVTAQPQTEPHKAVRNVTDGGAFGASTNADPGDEIEYRITIHNHGNASSTGVAVSDKVAARQTYLSCTGGCGYDAATRTVSWTVATVAPGAVIELTFLVRLDSVFPSGTTQIQNVAVADSDQEPPRSSPPTIVTVTAQPDPSLAKSADTGAAEVGQTVTYTLVYTNDGNGDAADVVITEPLPAGTSFVSCGGGCSYNSSTRTATWNLGTVEGAGGSRTVTLTVRVDSIANTSTCELCNTATATSPDHAGAVSSNRVCIPVTPTANPDGANASGSAYGASVQFPALSIDSTLPNNVNPSDGGVSSSQSGVGSSSQSDRLLAAAVPPPGGSILRASVLEAQTTSTVSRVPAEANSTGVAEATAVNILDGVVTADVVRGVASATATGSSATAGSEGSVIEGLMIDVDGGGPALPAVHSVVPNTRVILDPVVFGSDSFVEIYQRVKSTTAPTSNSGGTYTADVEVNMIRVHVTGGLVPEVEVVVSNAVAHADFPQTTVCGSVADRAVSGHAFIASAQTDPSLMPVLAGYVEIPATGGTATQHLNSVSLGTAATTGQADSSSTGTVATTSTSATSFAEAARVCVLPGSGSTCTVQAQVVRSEANSTATAGSRSSNANGTRFVNLVVAGIPVADTPAPNTTITLPGIGFVILNEQVCDNGGTLGSGCSDGVVAGHSGITVRAIRVVLLDPAAGGSPGGEIIVAEAHSDAKFV